MWHLFIESGLHNIKRHMDFGLQECKIIIVPMDIPTVINRPMKFLVQSLLSNCPYLYYWSVSVWWNENVSSKRKCFLGDLDCCLSLLQTKKYISNKSCSFEVSLHQRFLKEKRKKYHYKILQWFWKDHMTLKNGIVENYIFPKQE